MMALSSLIPPLYGSASYRNHLDCLAELARPGAREVRLWAIRQGWRIGMRAHLVEAVVLEHSRPDHGEHQPKFE
jgi:hypothetical protein